MPFVPAVPYRDGIPAMWPSQLKLGQTVVIQQTHAIALQGMSDSVTVGPLFEFLGCISTSRYHEIQRFCHLV